MTVTVNIFLSGGDGDGYGDFYSPVLTVMEMFKLLLNVDRKMLGKILLIGVSFWWIR